MTLTSPGRLALVLLSCLGCAPAAWASNNLDLEPDDSRHPRLSGVWYIAYVHEDVHARPTDAVLAVDFSRFEIQRGYVTYRTRISERLRARITSDISVDQEGDGAGDIELRLKYGYVEFDAGDLGPVRAGRLLAGVLPTPWLAFEQSVNDFRVQGPMFLNRERVFISSDFGVSFGAQLGVPIDDDFRVHVNRRNDGRWGSFGVGIFNGGGYNEIEQNESFVAQARLSVRPLPTILPGLQLTAGGGVGKGNTSEAPDYESLAGMISHEAAWGAVTVTGYRGVGDLRGNAVDENGDALDRRGGSVFGEARVFDDYSVIGRYDLFRTERETTELDTERWIAGVTWRCIPGGQLLLSYENVKRLGGSVSQRNERIISTLEIRF